MAEPRYRFSVDHENDDGRTTFSNTLEFDAEMLPDVIGNFELFLKGAGFAFDGHVDITPSAYTQSNSYNNLPDSQPPGWYEDNVDPDFGSHNSNIEIKRPADTEGGSIE
jgi:hypothetical protein